MGLQLMLVLVVLLVILPLYVIYKPPRFVIQFLQRRFSRVLFQVSTTRPVVALTIDDAPSVYTHEILEILRANEATATFFTIGGQVNGREPLLREILESGCELGNHAMHDEPSISLASDVLSGEIDQVDNLIDRAYADASQNRTAHYFRPGSGIFSERILDVAEVAGHRTVLGSIYPHDPFIKWWWLNSMHILSSLRPGAIIICHDRRGWTAPMLRRTLPEMRRRGFDIVTISELLTYT